MPNDMTKKERMKWIDNASLKELLRKNRFEPAGSPWFSGEVGDYFLKVMGEKKKADPAGWTRASKELGWQK